MNNVQKFVELANQLISEIKKTTGLNRSGITQAASLVSQGKVINSKTWVRPSAAKENAYIEENGMAAYGKWFLAIDANADMETKEHWHYIYTSDFVNVDRAGLIAIRQRSGQQNQTDVFNAAGKLLEKLDA
jgi:hypothetical protein